MNGSNILLDSNILIYASQGKFSIDTLLNKYERFYISIIT